MILSMCWMNTRECKGICIFYDRFPSQPKSDCEAPDFMLCAHISLGNSPGQKKKAPKICFESSGFPKIIIPSIICFDETKDARRKQQESIPGLARMLNYGNSFEASHCGSGETLCRHLHDEVFAFLFYDYIMLNKFHVNSTFGPEIAGACVFPRPRPFQTMWNHRNFRLLRLVFAWGNSHGIKQISGINTCGFPWRYFAFRFRSCSRVVFWVLMANASIYGIESISYS